MKLTNCAPGGFDPKQQAQEHKAAIEDYLKIKLDDFRDYRLLKAVYRLIQSHQAGERLPRTKKIRADHYFGLIRFMAVAMLYTDLSQNMVVARKKVHGKWVEVGADNHFFMLKLDVAKSTLDELIKTVKRLGWYISNIRYGYDLCGDGKRFYGKYSIKRVFIGVYDLFGMGKKVRAAIKKAVAFRQRNPLKSESKIQLPDGEFHNFGYGKENERRYLKRKERRVAKMTQSAAEAPSKNQLNHAQKLEEQIRLHQLGYSAAEIAAHQSGDKPIHQEPPK
ncbi:hypothetical protein BOO25_18680 [Vibrio navarrensis]|uniref:hypothetical protein n=1 Tax=Vibrio navarrensis TaxID=29495 RepID=UPI00192F9702|nr:hypothetical protein [Vibrio navarrensis]MBE3670956.1 hypothetical protein [Vibrio navarrensis]